MRVLRRAVSEAKTRGVLAALGHRATAQIEHDPDNPAANLIAGAAHAASEDVNLRAFSHRYFKKVAAVSRASTKDQGIARQGYEWYQAVDAAEAIRAYAVPEGALDNSKDLPQLLEHAKIAALDPAERDNLSVACLEQSQKAMVAQLKTLIPDLDELL
jgi:hypothetical protein